MKNVLHIAFGTSVDVDRLRLAARHAGAAHDALQGLPAPDLHIDAQALRWGVDTAIADAGSLRALAAQIAHSYDSGTPEPARWSFQQAHLTAWRQELERSEEGRAQRAYWAPWVSRMDALSPLALKFRQSAGKETPMSSHVHTELHLDGLTGLETSQIQAAWWLVLARLNGFQPFVGGSLHDCREDYAPMQGAVGRFEAILPLLLAPEPGQTFAQWSTDLAQTLSDHGENQELASVHPSSLRALFVSEPEMPLPGAAAGWQVAVTSELPPGAELVLRVRRTAQGLGLVLVADAACYGRPALEALLAPLTTALRAVAARTDTRLGDIDLVSDGQRRALLSLAGPVRDYAGATLGERIAAWRLQTPDAPALRDAGGILTYAALDRRVTEVAQALRAQGLHPGGLVGLNMPRSVDLVVAMLAAWRAGAAFLPLDPAWPEARRQALQQDSGTALVIDALPALPVSGQCSLPVPQPSGRAYVLYTSGSTGQPKGVAVGQGALLNYVAAAGGAMDLQRCRCWALTSAVTADLGNTALFGALFHGACLVIARDDEVKDAAAFSHFITAHKIDALKIVPSHLEALLEHDAPHLPATVVLGGEPASPGLIGRLRAIEPGLRLFNHYGPTETTVGVMVHAIGAGDEGAAIQPLTEVLANNRARVLDADHRLVPVGTVGELYIGGAQLCEGYLHQDVAGVFVDDPYLPDAKLYRTGDLAWVRPQGGLALTGRADHQLKLRGYRVDPAEVEAALLGLPGVRQALVAGWRPPEGPDAPLELVAVVVATGDTTALRQRLAALLPPPMVPARIQAVEDLPRLANGKVDRRACMALFAQPAAPVVAAAAETDEVQTAITQHLMALLQKESLATSDDIFELGAHSLMVIKLVARLRKQLGIEFAPAVVFDNPTPGGLAAALRTLRQEAEA